MSGTAARLQVVVDAADPHAMARFWAAVLGYEVEDHSGIVTGLLEAGRLAPEEVTDVDGRPAFADLAAVTDPTAQRPRVLLQRVPEPKTTKNRVHLDVQVGADAREGEVARIVALGARVLWTVTDRGPAWTTLADPEGNEFCVS